MSMRAIATGIGSMPFTDPADAVNLIFKYIPEAPFWPQLPRRNVREGMIAQYSEAMPGLKVTNEGIQFERRAADESLESFYEHIISMDLDYFRINRDYAAGLYAFYSKLKQDGITNAKFIKCQVTGPLTFAAGINDADAGALIHDEIMMQAIVKGLAMKALWQVKIFSEFSKPIIVFVDEPYLAGLGSAYTALSRETAVRILREVSAAIKTHDVLVGVHCCGNTDWSIFTDVRDIDIINFDAFNFLDRFTLYGKEVAQFIERGGYICWGIVPTQEFNSNLAAETLYNKLRQGIDALVRKGADPYLVAEQLLISPACGLGSIDPFYPSRSCAF